MNENKDLQVVGRNEIAWTDDQVKLIKDTICRGATDDELKLFLYTCKRCGLDPLAKQIYAVKRWDSNLRREVMTVQTGIDGYRVVAERSGGYAGVDEPKFTFDHNDNLESASVTVYRIVSGQRVGFNGTAFWEEYVQTTKEGEPTKFWKKMPRSQLAKCAEALALRRAFPNDLSGIYTKEEMEQADNPKPDSNVMDGPDNIKELMPFPAKWKTKCFVCGEVHPAGTQIISVPNMEKTFASAQCWDAMAAKEEGGPTITPEPEEIENKRNGTINRILAGETLLSDNKIESFDKPKTKQEMRKKWLSCTDLEQAATVDLVKYLDELLRLAKSKPRTATNAQSAAPTTPKATEPTPQAVSVPMVGDLRDRLMPFLSDQQKNDWTDEQLIEVYTPTGLAEAYTELVKIAEANGVEV